MCFFRFMLYVCAWHNETCVRENKFLTGNLRRILASGPSDLPLLREHKKVERFSTASTTTYCQF